MELLFLFSEREKEIVDESACVVNRQNRLR
jgi:hypothetical protein